MTHDQHHVVVHNKDATVIGTKLRKDVNKHADILHCVTVFVLHPDGRVALSRIPEGDLYGGKWSSSCATMLRAEEREDDAAARALKKELGMQETPTLLRIGSQFFQLEGGVKRMKTVYVCRYSEPFHPNAADVSEVMLSTPERVAELCQTNEAAPSLKALWNQYEQDIKNTA